MSKRLIFAVLSLGVMMTCTFVTAHAADYRKEKVEKYGANYEALTSDATLATYHFNMVYDFMVPENHFVFTPQVTYVFPENEPKPKNRHVNGLINDKREQERICVDLNL